MAHPVLAKKLEHAKESLKRLGKKLGRGWKGSAMSAGTGAGVYFAMGSAAQKVEALRKPYAIPLVLAIGGHFVKHKNVDAGAAMLGIAGFLGAQQYDQSQSQQQQQGGGGVAQQGAGFDGGNAGMIVRVQNEKAGLIAGDVGDNTAVSAAPSVHALPQRISIPAESTAAEALSLADY